MSALLITTSSFDTSANPALRELAAKGYQIITNPHKRRLTEDEAIELFTKYDPVGMIAGVEPLTRRALERAPKLRVIARCGTGLDSVDLDAARELGKAVYNTPDATSQPVAELTIGLILAALRHITLADREIRNQKWQARMGNLLQGKCVGLIGGGRIGLKVADLVSGFGADIVIHDPIIDASQLTYRLVELDDLLTQADIVSLHVPHNETTHELINGERLSQMKPTAILINAARGGLVNEAALYDALKNKRIGGAALDVFEQEPYDGPLIELDNLVLTAHMGSYAAEARTAMEIEAARLLLNGLEKADFA